MEIYFAIVQQVRLKKLIGVSGAVSDLINSIFSRESRESLYRHGYSEVEHERGIVWECLYN